MATYTYTGKTTSPNLTQIHVDVAASAMTDKTIEYCDWNLPGEVNTLKVYFTGTLSGGDETILDGIVSDNS